VIISPPCQIAVGGGGSGPGYTWRQSTEQVQIAAVLPPGVRGRDVRATCKNDSVRLALAGDCAAVRAVCAKGGGDATAELLLVAGKWKELVKADEFVWDVEDNVLLATVSRTPPACVPAHPAHPALARDRQRVWCQMYLSCA
jgi:hypothetical protein